MSKASLLALAMLALPATAFASLPVTEKDALVCLSGAGVPAKTEADAVRFDVDGKNEMPVTESSHFMVRVELDSQHRINFRKDGQLLQALDVDFKDYPSQSTCLRYNSKSRLWSITPADKGNICLDCAPDWVKQEPAYVSPPAGKE
jgi:hypothetical protein